MRILNAVLFLLLFVQDRSERCDHGTRGATKGVDLVRLEKSYADFARVVQRAMPRIDPKLALDAPYESGLPACTERRVRRVKRHVPPEMIGRTIIFGPPQEGIVFVTRAKRLRDALGYGLATAEAAARFGVTCAPTTVTVRRGELELIENP